jgi:hypothetical protein
MNERQRSRGSVGAGAFHKQKLNECVHKAWVGTNAFNRARSHVGG